MGKFFLFKIYLCFFISSIQSSEIEYIPKFKQNIYKNNGISISCLCFSQDEKYLVINLNGLEVHIIETENWQTIRSLSLIDNDLPLYDKRYASFSLDNNYLICMDFWGFAFTAFSIGSWQDKTLEFKSCKSNMYGSKINDAKLGKKLKTESDTMLTSPTGKFYVFQKNGSLYFCERKSTTGDQ